MKLDLNLLKKLLVINHPSQQEYPMMSFIINECYKIGGLEFEIDNYCNLFITKNTTDPEYYPVVVAHMDCVLEHSNKDVLIRDGKIYGRNRLSGKKIGLGMDDANGICIAIQLLKVIPDLKVCFTTEEEVGFKGATEASENVDFFYNASYLIQADRHGGSDLITYTNWIYSASETWLQEVTPIMIKYNYKEQDGIGTDIGVLAEKLQLSGVNVSCGYYKEHTDQEYTVISELKRCLNFIKEIIDTVPTDKQYAIEVKYNYYSGKFAKSNWDFNYNSQSDVYDDYDDYYSDLPCNTCINYDCMNCSKFDTYGQNKSTKGGD